MFFYFLAFNSDKLRVLFDNIISLELPVGATLLSFEI